MTLFLLSYFFYLPVIHNHAIDYFCFQCDKCGLRFKQGFRFNYHRKMCGRTCVCEVCSKECKTSESLRRHVRSVHLKIAPYQCQVCDKSFVCNAHLRQHINIHEGIRFKCDHCDMTFSTKGNLRKHCKRIHTEIN